MGMSDTSINNFNLKIRTSPWYQEWFAAKGLNPDKVQLSKDQRNELKAVVEQNTGFKFPGDMKIDPAGNLNEKGGWAGLPTGVKIALIAAAAVGTAGAAGAFGGAAAVPNAVPAVAGSVAPVLPATPAALAGGTAAATAAGTGGTIAKIAGAVTGGGSTMDKIGTILRGGAGAIGSATEAAAQRRANEADNITRAQALNMQGENAFQSQQLAQAREEAAQRDEARKNLYRASIMKNPQTSVENPRGAPTFSPEMMEGLTNLEKQALQRTSEGPQFKTSQMRGPQFAPLDPEQVSRTSRPGTMETVGNWLAPALSLTDLFTDVF